MVVQPRSRPVKPLGIAKCIHCFVSNALFFQLKATVKQSNVHENDIKSYHKMK